MIPSDFHRVQGRLPWGQLPDHDCPQSAPRILYEPVIGWFENRWYDGPTFLRVDGRVRYYQLPGAEAPLPPILPSDGPDDLSAFIAAQAPLAWKKSLAKAFRAAFRFDRSAHHLQGLRFDANSALILLGLRLGFPRQRFFLFDGPADWKPQWKRLAQNLNFETWASPTQKQALAPLDLTAAHSAWDQAAAVHFLRELNSKIPFIPGKLLETFSRP